MVNFVIALELTAPTVEAVMTAVAVENIGSAFVLLLKVFEQALG